jgi:hypothetical protein
MSFAIIIGAATSRVRGRAGRAARQQVAARTVVSPPDRTMLLLLALDEPLWAGAFVGAALVLGAVALELRGR